MFSPTHAAANLALLTEAELLFSADAVDAAVSQLAAQLTADLGDRYPLVLAVMGGAGVFTGQLLPRLTFPLDFDYIHVSRYGEATTGGELVWRHAPKEAVQGRVVLVLDDILDEGHTLHAIHERVMALGAKACYSAVLANKLLDHAKPLTADYVGLDVPNRYVFGYGMDVRGAWRNLPAIYALNA